MTPFEVLGVPANCALDVAKNAYRRLASQYHPDKYPTHEKAAAETKFKAIKAAWELIEGGYVQREAAPPSPPPKSSFTGGGAKPQKPHQSYAGQAAPGYEAKKTPPVLPHTYMKPGAYRNSRQYAVKLEITEQQAFEGCTVPFWHDGTVRDYVVRPGTSSRIEFMSYPHDEMIGRSIGFFTIEIELVVLPASFKRTEPKRDAEMDLQLCALGLFTGGRVSVLDHLGEKVTITIPPGYDPSEPFKIPNHGFGDLERGALIVKIVPVFKVPTELNQNERAQLKRLNEMTR